MRAIQSIELVYLMNDRTIECRDNSFWAGATASKYGKLSFDANYPYEPYAFVRVDNTDSFGGGTLKAIDPKTPFRRWSSYGNCAKL